MPRTISETTLESIRDNLTNGNCKDACDQASKFTYAALLDAMRTRLSPEAAKVTTDYLKRRITFQAYCDGLRGTEKQKPEA